MQPFILSSAVAGTWSNCYKCTPWTITFLPSPPSPPSHRGYFLLQTAYLLSITCFTLTITVLAMRAPVPVDTRPLCTLCTRISSLLPYVSWHDLCAPFVPTSPHCYLMYHGTINARFLPLLHVYYHTPYTCLSSISTGRYSALYCRLNFLSNQVIFHSLVH